MADKNPKSETRLAVSDPFADLDPFERWNPFRPLFGSRGARNAEDPIFAQLQRSVSPPVDIAEDDDAYHVSVELPGASKSDLTIEVKDDLLTVRGEKKSERQDRKEHPRRVERFYGAFSRSFTLPPNAAADRISASFENGVLALAIPKREEAKPRVVSVR